MTFEDYLLQEAHQEDVADDIVKIAAELDTMTDDELYNLEAIIDGGAKEKSAEATLLAEMAADALREPSDVPASPDQMMAQQQAMPPQGMPPQQEAPQQGPPQQGPPQQGPPQQGQAPEVAMAQQGAAGAQQGPPPAQGQPPQQGPPGMPPQMLQALMMAAQQGKQQGGQPPQGQPMKTASMDVVDGWAREMAQHELRKHAASNGASVSQSIMAEAVQHLVAGNIQSFEDVSWGMSKIAALEKEAVVPSPSGLRMAMILKLLKAFGKSWKKGALGPRGSLTSMKGLKGTKKLFRAGPYKGVQKAYAKGKAGYGQQNLMAYEQLAKQLGHLTGRGAPILAGTGLYAAS